MALRALAAQLDDVVESHALFNVELLKRISDTQWIMEIEKPLMLDLKQKVCIKLTIDWDGNSKFFHGNVNNKNRKNIINELMINGRWSIDVDEIKNETYKFFPSDL